MDTAAKHAEQARSYAFYAMICAAISTTVLGLQFHAYAVLATLDAIAFATFVWAAFKCDQARGVER